MLVIFHCKFSKYDNVRLGLTENPTNKPINKIYYDQAVVLKSNVQNKKYSQSINFKKCFQIEHIVIKICIIY